MRYLLFSLLLLGSAIGPTSAAAEAPVTVDDGEEAERQRVIEWKLEVLQRQKRDLRLGKPAAGVAFSVLGLAAGTWMLSYAGNSPRVSDDRCIPGNDGTLLGGLCLAGSAPYAGTVMIGISIGGLARTAKELRRRKRRKRRIQASIRELTRQAN